MSNLGMIAAVTSLLLVFATLCLIFRWFLNQLDIIGMQRPGGK